MAVSRFQSVNQLVNTAAIQVGLTPVTDVFAASDPAFNQLTSLISSGLQTLMEDFVWNSLVREFQFTTVEDEEGKIDLPPDFGYMIPQTGWERSENVPLIGPLSAQDWTYLLGRDLVTSTIYASFRFDQNQLYIFPQSPMRAGLDINFEYISRNLFQLAATDPPQYCDVASNATDVALFPPNLVIKQLKMLFLNAKGFDSQVATNEFNKAIESWMGKDNTAGVLNAGRWRRWYPYLDVYRNLPDTGYGF